MNTQTIIASLERHFTILYTNIINWLQSPSTYLQAACVIVAFILSYYLAKFIRARVDLLKEPGRGVRIFSYKWFLHRSGRLLYPIFTIILLFIFGQICDIFVKKLHLINAVSRVLVVWLLWVTLKAFVVNAFIRTIGLWILVPSALLQLFGWFSEVTHYLDQFGFAVGQVNITIYTLIKGIFFVSLIVWFGKMMSQFGANYIRRNTDYSLSTRELFVKVFDIGLYIILFIITLDLIGIDLTALAVFGGALGVGLGFGLQKIASNFISSLILLTEKSINLNDLIEMNDGTYGYVRKLGARASVIETFDGKEVIVPNEDFITSRVANLTHTQNFSRVDVKIGVSYDSDLKLVFDLILKAANEYERASQLENYQPQCYLQEFADSSVNFLLTFWLEDVKQGRWRARSDVLFTIWQSFKDHNIEIPFPQRDIHLKTNEIQKDIIF